MAVLLLILPAAPAAADSGSVSTQGSAAAEAHRVIRVAHRGGAALAPENTLAAFRAGLEQGADALELDVHLSRDGELVVIHDAALARTTNAAGEVGEMTFAELRRLDASARFFGPPVERQLIPTLQEVVDLAKGRASLQIEIKLRSDGSRYPGIEPRVVETLRQSGMVDDAVILSFDFPTLTSVKALEQRLRTCALISRAYLQKVGKRGPAAVAEEMAALGVTSVGVEKTWLLEPLYRQLRSRGLGVGVWTVDDSGEMRRFALMGVDFITSNRPDLLRHALVASDGPGSP
ncbi:MAG: glycerophosphodiester phosphodiesterase family protein [Spirochaetes bacterium]|nr:glycerophosphodiester phosphodiesterase family protein [Spirochaetota bacterium]